MLCALEAAHALGVVHRDLKPENVFITFASGKPVLKLIDFGIAKLRNSDPGAKNLTVAGVLMGTAEYMAPEQAYSADKVDARSDIYAVGVMLYELISGQRPVVGDDARLIAVKVERGEVIPLVHAAPDVPREVAGLVHRAMAARPELRFASATEMRLALEGALSGKRPPTAQLSAVPGTGTVMGAPADAILGAGLKLDPRMAAMPAGTGTIPAPPDVPQAGLQAGTRAGGGGPMGVAPAMPHAHTPRYPSSPPRRRRSRAPMVGMFALAFLALGGVAAAYYSYWQSSELPAPIPTVAHIAQTATATTPTATQTPTAATNDPLTPLGTSTVRPPQPPPQPHPHASGTPSSKPSGSNAPPDAPPTSPFPTVFPSSFPNPFPPGSSGAPPVFTIPTAFPSVFPPLFSPPPASSAAPGN